MLIVRQMDWQLRARLRAIAEEYFADNDGSHRLDHTLRVVANTRSLMAHYTEIDHAVLEASAWLHDIGRGREQSEGISHAIISSRSCADILAAEGFSPAQIQLARQVIAEHRFSSGQIPQSPEGKLLQDADRLDALGAIGIARTFMMGRQRALYHPDDPFARQRTLDDNCYTLDHFYTKLLKLPATMHTPEGRTLAELRLQYMQGFLHELARELSMEIDEAEKAESCV